MTDEQLLRHFDEVALPIVVTTLPVNSMLVRMRENVHRLEDFDTVDKMGCRPTELVCEYQRANVPKMSVFYCTLFPNSLRNLNPRGGNSDSPIPEGVTLYESSSLAREKSKTGSIVCTFSYWSNIRSLTLASIPGFDYPSPCDKLRDINKRWRKILHNKANELDNVSDVLKAFTKDGLVGSEYQVSACYCKWVFERRPDVDGIIYPTVKAEGVAMNIAFRESVIKRDIQFIHSFKYYWLKRKDKLKSIPLLVGVVDGKDRVKYYRHPIFKKAASLFKISLARRIILWVAYLSGKSTLPRECHVKYRLRDNYM